jgi:hypothetical protein
MFRVKNLNSHIQYYTIVVDHDQIKENKDDSPKMIIKRRPTKQKNFSRQFESFVIDGDTGKWRSEMTYY